MKTAAVLVAISALIGIGAMYVAARLLVAAIDAMFGGLG